MCLSGLASKSRVRQQLLTTLLGSIHNRKQQLIILLLLLSQPRLNKHLYSQRNRFLDFITSLFLLCPVRVMTIHGLQICFLNSRVRLTPVICRLLYIIALKELISGFTSMFPILYVHARLTCIITSIFVSETPPNN